MSSRQPDLKKGIAGEEVFSLQVTMLASASAGMVARIPCHPLDTCKAKLQVQKAQGVYGNFVDVFVKTWRQEGRRGLYKGFGTAFIGSGPAGCLYFTTYEKSKELLLQIPFLQRSPGTAHFTAGLLAEVVSCILWVPIDVVKERLQVQSTLSTLHRIPNTGTSASILSQSNQSLQYKGNLDAFATILRTEGVRGVYKGYGATIASFGPFSALYFLFYEKLKRGSEYLLVTNTLPFPAILTCAATAGSLASLITNPLDMAKLRLQVERSTGSRTFNYKNIFDGVTQIARDEGLRGMFKGAGARMAFQAPTTAIALTAFEQLKRMYQYLDVKRT
jgi:hypothetical protein